VSNNILIANFLPGKSREEAGKTFPKAPSPSSKSSTIKCFLTSIVAFTTLSIAWTSLLNLKKF